MYIPEFVCGFVSGAIIGTVTLIIIAVIHDKHDRKK